MQHTTNGTNTDYYLTEVRTASLYSAYGAIANAYNAANIKIGYNGKLRTTEIGANNYDYGARIYNGDVGRFPATDPITYQYPELTPYQFASNNPIAGIDMDGLEFLSTVKAYQNRQFELQNAALNASASKPAPFNPPVPVIQPVNSEASVPLQQLKARVNAMRPVSPEEQKKRNLAAITKKAFQNQAAVGSAKLPGPANEFEAGGVQGVQMAAVVIGAEACPTCFIAYGSTQVYNGVQNGDAGQVLSGGLNIAGGLFSKFSGISTPYGIAKQSLSQDALNAASEAAKGKTLYKVGTFGRSEAAESQFWSLEDPTPYLDNPQAFANKYGIPAENLLTGNLFIIKGQLGKGQNFITRPAPPVSGSTGGSVEVVTNPNGVSIESFQKIKN